MNGNSPYQLIYEYCQNEKKDKIIERILYHKYTEELTELIDSYKNDNNAKEPTNDTIEGYTATLLSKNNLSKNVRLAEEELDDVLDVKIKKIKKEIGRINFWKSVWASVLASFIFILLMIAFFLVAENQVKSLFHIDTNGNTKTEQLKEPINK